MRDFRLLAALAATLIALAGVMSVTAGGTPPLPPPVALRESSSADTSVTFAEGLEFIPPTLADLVPPTTAGELTEPDSPDSGDVPAAPADSPDHSLGRTEGPPAPAPVDSIETASADSPDEAVSDPVADSPDLPDSPDSVDSPDPADSPDD